MGRAVGPFGSSGELWGALKIPNPNSKAKDPKSKRSVWPSRNVLSLDGKAVGGVVGELWGRLGEGSCGGTAVVGAVSALRGVGERGSCGGRSI